MTLEQDVLRILIQVHATEAVRAFATLQKQIAITTQLAGGRFKSTLQVPLTSMADGIIRNQKMQENYWKSYFANTEGATRLTTNYTGKAAAGIKRMNMAMLGLGLSTLFFGMAMKRLGEGVLKSLVKTYMTATDETSLMNRELLAAQASFEFLKFSIMDALGQSDLFIAFIEGFISVINWVSTLITKFPEIGTGIVGAFGVLAAGGSVMMIVAQFLLLWVGLDGMGFLPVSLAKIMGTKTGEAGTVAGSMKTGMGVLGAIVAGGILIGAGIYMFGKKAGEPYTATEMFTLTGLAFMAGFRLGGYPGAFASALIVLSIIAIRSGAAEKVIEQTLQWVNNKTEGSIEIVSELLDKVKAAAAGAGTYEKAINVHKYGASGLESTMYPRETIGSREVTVNIYGDVKDESLLNKLKMEILDALDADLARKNGTTTGG